MKVIVPVAAALAARAGEIHVLVAGSGCAAAAEQAAKLDGIAKATLADAAAHYADHAAENLAALIASKLIGVNVRTLQNWEQHRTRPTGPARALLKIVASDPKSAIEALHA